MLDGPFELESLNVSPEAMHETNVSPPGAYASGVLSPAAYLPVVLAKPTDRIWGNTCVRSITVHDDVENPRFLPHIEADRLLEGPRTKEAPCQYEGFEIDFFGKHPSMMEGSTWEAM